MQPADGLLAIANFLQFLKNEFTPIDWNALVVAAVSDRHFRTTSIRAIRAMELKGLAT